MSICISSVFVTFFVLSGASGLLGSSLFLSFCVMILPLLCLLCSCLAADYSATYLHVIHLWHPYLPCLFCSSFQIVCAHHPRFSAWSWLFLSVFACLLTFWADLSLDFILARPLRALLTWVFALCEDLSSWFLKRSFFLCYGVAFLPKMRFSFKLEDAFSLSGERNNYVKKYFCYI